MSWPYHLVVLTREETALRRVLLNRYGLYAQLSAFIPILGYQIYKLAIWVYSERSRAPTVNYSEVPSSPTLKRHRGSTSGTAVSKWRSLMWWLEGEIAPGWGLRGQWIAGGSWTAWLLFLCVHRTGDDYLHVTKRFGHVAASQFPLHYALSMKSYASPLAILFNSSHEQLNPWHRISGRIIYFLLLNHAAWYMNFFVQAGVLYKRLTALVVIIGIVAFFLLTVIGTTSLSSVRKWNYRVFFVLHLIIGVSILPLLFFHTPELRFYTIEALALFIIDIVCRKLSTTTGFATITKVPNTKLVKLKVLIPATKLEQFRAFPGQHVYLSIPPESTPPTTSSPSIFDLLFNPFTVADVSATDITLVLRSLRGPTTNALENLASLTKARPPINLEGPYGSSRRFPNLTAKYDRILLVAGGVGATFTLPIYRDLRDQLETEAKSPDNIKFIWSMRSSAEAAWASQSPESGTSLAEDMNVKVFFTRGASADRYHSDDAANGSMELQSLQEPTSPNGGRDRPDLRKIVDEVFRYGNEERVAVLVCGPTNMARELRKHVGRWVSRGREVFWHDESFGL